MRKRKSTLQKELIVLCVFTCVVAMIVQGGILTSVFARIFSKNVREDISFYVERVNNDFNNKLQFLEESITYIRNDSIMADFFNDVNYSKEEVSKRLSYCGNLFSERNMVNQNYPFITQIFLFNNNGDSINSVFYPTTIEHLKLVSEEYSEINKKFLTKNSEYYFKINESSVDIIFKIYDKYLVEKGSCLVQLNSLAIKEIFNEIEKYNDSKWVLVGNDSLVVQSNNIEDIYDEIIYKENVNVEDNKKDLNSKYFVSQKQNSFGLKTMVLVSKSNIYDYIKSSIMIMVGIIIILLLCIAAIVFFVAYRFTVPLKMVADKIREFGKGNFDTKLEEFNTQELTDISFVFNEMTDKINYLIKQVYENQLLTTKAQIQYLQSQINPHFMFNILSMIGIKAKMSDNDEVHKMIYAFSKLIQGKIFRKEEITIPLSEEMELVEFYLFLQSNRFADKISYNITYEDEELKKILIPRLSIEPIVENAVLHGLEPKEDSGKIEVLIRKDGDSLLIEVKDDGVGFNQEESYNDTVAYKEHTHVGIYNTQKLINNLYGDDFGIDIESKVGVGTSVFIKLPM